MSFKQGSTLPEGVEFSYIPIQLDDLSLINPLKCDKVSQFQLDSLITKLSTSDAPNLLIVSVPGSFTPTCTERHIPEYLENLDKLSAKKIGAVLVLATNDAFVVNAWGKLLVKEYAKIDGKIPEILFASDGGFSAKNGLAGDRGGIIRNKRYAAIVDSKTRNVLYLGVETESGVHVS
ncbi:Peroxiredoxin-like protein, partial [Candida maltosa Xu316]